MKAFRGPSEEVVDMAEVVEGEEQHAYFTLQELYDGGLNDTWNGIFKFLNAKVAPNGYHVGCYKNEGVVKHGGPIAPTYRLHISYSLVRNK